MNKTRFEMALKKLRVQAERRYGKESAEFRIEMSKKSADDLFTRNGKAWRIFLIQTIARWVYKKPPVFIPPSPETLEWGGFLGGEWVNN
jgi:hypothetical protein